MELPKLVCKVIFVACTSFNYSGCSQQVTTCASFVSQL